MNFIMSHQLSFFEINRYVIFEQESAPVPDRGSKFEVKNYMVDFFVWFVKNLCWLMQNYSGFGILAKLYIIQIMC